MRTHVSANRGPGPIFRSSSNTSNPRSEVLAGCEGLPVLTDGFLLPPIGTMHMSNGANEEGQVDASLIMDVTNLYRNNARHSNTIATHIQGRLFTVFIKDRRVHCLRIFLPQLEYMANLDTPTNQICPRSIRCWVPFNGIPQICDFGLITITVQLIPSTVPSILICACPKIRTPQLGGQQ